MMQSFGYAHTPSHPTPEDAVARTIYVSGIDPALLEEDIKGLFTTCGPIRQIKLCGDITHPTRFAFVEFMSIYSAGISLSFNNFPVGSCALKVAPAKSSICKTSPVKVSIAGTNRRAPLPLDKQEATLRTIYIGGIDHQMTEEYLIEFFMTKVGPVIRSRIAGNKMARFAFIEFGNRDHVGVALKMDGMMIGSSQISISVAKTPIMNDTSAGVVNFVREKLARYGGVTLLDVCKKCSGACACQSSDQSTESLTTKTQSLKRSAESSTGDIASKRAKVDSPQSPPGSRSSFGSPDGDTRRGNHVTVNEKSRV
eukprot:TRINITY_DN1345_c0_g1_i1.p1 TRINITY_DN1345_c0_g1~~TRINITY_DN1345_c0_g1_i1.p1  ORF type:complete len:319 (+),score=36.43 TRINITY_DN1345_c0_g1_i1:26-958(+)